MESSTYYKSLQPLPVYGTYGTTVTTVCMACYSIYGLLQFYSIFQGLLMLVPGQPTSDVLAWLGLA
jgi:hypothetical protein